MQSFDIEYSEEKNELLKKIRGVCFDDVVDALEHGGFVTILESQKRMYQHQQVLVVRVNDYIHAVPFVRKTQKKVFLKTAFPDRKLHKVYGGKYE